MAGARAILEDFGDKVPIQEVVFLARQYPADFDVFAYIVLLSFKTSPEARNWVLYFVSRHSHFIHPRGWVKRVYG